MRSAFGYVVRQKGALMRFLEDGRLRVDNNASERALRQNAVGRITVPPPAEEQAPAS